MSQQSSFFTRSDTMFTSSILVDFYSIQCAICRYLMLSAAIFLDYLCFLVIYPVQKFYSVANKVFVLIFNLKILPFLFNNSIFLGDCYTEPNNFIVRQWQKLLKIKNIYKCA